ncbi:hypothetical protein AAC387_Pa01g2086 [Persea americana]
MKASTEQKSLTGLELVVKPMIMAGGRNKRDILLGVQCDEEWTKETVDDEKGSSIFLSDRIRNPSPSPSPPVFLWPSQLN